MPRVRTFRLTRRVAAPVEVVWPLLADHAGYARWTPLPVSRLETAGTDDPNGVGAVRFLGVGSVGLREKVLAFTHEEHLAYTIVAGLPVRDHRADVRLESDGGGTEIDYACSFEPTLPVAGPVMELVLRGAIQAMLGALDREATGSAPD